LLQTPTFHPAERKREHHSMSSPYMKKASHNWPTLDTASDLAIITVPGTQPAFS
jgi:hypothetical protein